VFTPTNPVEPVTNILMLPAPSEMKMLHDWVPKPLALAEPKITLQAPLVIQVPAFLPIAVLLLPTVFQIKAS